MNVLLFITGAVLLLDALVAALMILTWAGRGRAPGFLELSAYGVLSVLMVVLKTIGGVTGAIQLWRLRQSGRVIAGVVTAYNIAFVLFAAIRSNALGASVWGTVGWNVALLVIVALPAAGRACEQRLSPPTRLRNTPPASAVDLTCVVERAAERENQPDEAQSSWR